MKRPSFLLFVLSVLTALPIQMQAQPDGIAIDELHFPDENFRNWILAEDFGQDGVLTYEEIAHIEKMDVNMKSIKDLSGIEFFNSLKELDCGSNPLTSLDVSHNTALTNLKCNQCIITELRLPSPDYSKLAILNILANQIKGAAMDALIENLPMASKGWFIAIESYSGYEQNVVTKEHVARAKEKGWTTFCLTNSGLSEYEGCDIIAIDATNFPDENFRKWLLAQDYGQDGVLTENEISAVEDVDVSGQNISSLKGIENFIALKRLKCNNNQLTTLDVSGLESLRFLNCGGNQLTTLDVSNNPELEILVCSNNQIEELNLSNNKALGVLICNNNGIRGLDLTKNTALSELECNSNPMFDLDVSGCSVLKRLECYDSGLEHLNVSGCTMLEKLMCGGYLHELDVSGCSVLHELWCQSNIRDAAMDALIAGLPDTGGVFYAGNIVEPYVLTNDQVAAAREKGWTVYYFNTDSNEWEEYEGSSFVVEGIAIDATNFPDMNFRKWVSDQSYGQDGVLTEEEIAAVTSINVSDKGIAHLKGIEFFTALTNLYCFDNELTMIDVSKNTALVYLDCSRNQLTTLDVSKNTALTTLDCSFNKLASLDVSSNTVLRNFYCAGNQLTSLNVSNNAALRYYTCGGNQLTSIDVSKNTALVSLDCNDNKLTSLDVSNNTALTQLNCFFNQIKDAAMDALIAGLPGTGGQFYATYADDGYEQNVVTQAQVAAAKKKGWTIYYYSYGTWQWEEYESGTPQDITPVEQGETIDIGTEIDESTNLDGNVVGDVFYNISSGDGSYNAAEGCIVVTKPTDDSAIDGKDIFGEDFKDGFTGIVFKVQAGSGTVKVEAQTQGNMVLKVKIGNGAPVEMELDGKLKISFPYSVSEDTYVYIYGGSKAAGAKGMNKAPSDGDMLKIYGIEVVSDADGISSIENGKLETENAPTYNLNGQRVSEPAKGIYIRNGRKVLVK